MLRQRPARSRRNPRNAARTEDLLEASDIRENEQIHVWDIANGARFVTYAIEGEPGSGVVQVNGAAARLVRRGDKVIVASFATFGPDDLERHSPVVVHVDDDNSVTAVDSDPSVLLGGISPAQEALL